MRKQFTRKGIEKLFKAIYSEGEICLDGTCWNWWYCINENSRTIKIKGSNLYDVAEELSLVNKDEIISMKKLAGYVVVNSRN